MDVAAWLLSLGLERYARAFASNDIDAQVLWRLTDADLLQIGVKSAEHRQVLLQAIAALARSVTADLPSPAAPPAREAAEHRQLSVLNCDMVGATALSQRLHPEDLHEMIGAFHGALTGIVREFDGQVANLIGNCVLAYFGWPRAHEDDAERAVRAGLAMAKAAARLRTPAGAALAVRVGIATGPVVVGDLVREGPAQTDSVVGATPQLSAQLRTLGAPGQVVIDELTRRLLPASFSVQPLPDAAIEGRPLPVAACVVSGEQPTDSRFDARMGLHLPPMVGRDRELALLLERWAQARGGEGQAVLLLGEAGIGKSRLVRALLDACAQDPHELIRWQCSPYHASSALWPVTQRLGRSAGLLAQDPVDIALDKLEALAGDRDPQAMALYATLLGLDGSQRYGPLGMSPPSLRQSTLELLIEHVLQMAGRRPLLMVVEDVHWIDPTTLELLEHCLDSADRTRTLILMTSRTDQQPHLRAHPSMTQLSLNRLSHSNADAIVMQLGGAALQAPTRAAIVAQSDRVPLFVEELTKMVLATGEASIPDSLQGSLMARLDSMPEAREVAQIASCIGREFDEELVRSVADRPDRVASALEQLARAELVFRKGGPSSQRFTFKHALVQEAAYESLLRGTRRSLHARVLEALEPRHADTPPEILAHHAAGADLADKAIDYSRQAGDAAMAKSAYVEATAYFDRAIRHIAGQSDGKDRRNLEFELQLGLANAHVAVHGYAAEATKAAFQRAEELLDDDPVRRLRVDSGLWGCHAMRGHFAEALPRATRVLVAAMADGRNETKLAAHRIVGVSHLCLGELGNARDHLERALALYDPEKPAAPATWFALDPGAAAHGYLAWTVCLQGFAEQSKILQERALAIASVLAQANATVAIHQMCSVCAACTRDVVAARTHAQALAELVGQHRLAAYEGYVSRLLAWVAMESGRPAEEVVASYEASRPSASRVHSGFFLGGQAVALAAAGRHEEALGTIEHAIVEAEQMAQGWCDAELWRLRGELLLGKPRHDPAQALDCLVRALTIARRRGARLWELRAAVSLARLWDSRGEAAKASHLLAPIYGWFTEGFDTVDLGEARALQGALVKKQSS